VAGERKLLELLQRTAAGVGVLLAELEAAHAHTRTRTIRTRAHNALELAGGHDECAWAYKRMVG
jgi:hypothetical protein